MPRVQDRDHVWLNGHLFRIDGGVQRQIANQFAEKTVIGDFTEASDPVLSNVTWDNFAGGQGRYLIPPNELTKERLAEFWEGIIRNDIPGHAVPQLQFALAAGQTRDSAGTDTSLKVIDWEYGAHAGNNSFQIYFVATDSANLHVLNQQGEFVQNLHSRPLDFRIGRVGEVEMFAVAESSAVEWGHSSTDLTDSGNWNTDSGQVMRSVVFWRNLLWGVSDSGELFFSSEATSTSTLNWTKVAVTDKRTGVNVRRLITAEMSIPGSEDKEHLFLIRDDGFDIYDRLTEKLTPAFRLPSNKRAGHGAVGWNGSLFYSYGLGLWQWTPTPNGNIASNIGLDQKEGVSEAWAGYIFDVAASPRQLFVSVQNGSSALPAAVYSRTVETGWTRTYDPLTQTVSSAALTARMYVGPYSGSLSSTLSENNFFIAPGYAFQPGQYWVYHAALGNEVINSDSRANRIPFITGNSCGLITSPWIIADANQDWTAYKISVEVSYLRSSGAVANNASSFELFYSTNNQDSVWNKVLQLSSDSVNDINPQGRFEISLPSAANPIGVPFTSIRWKAAWSAVNTSQNAYDLHRLSLVFQKRPKLREAFTFDIDFSRDNQPQGRSPAETRKLIRDFIKQTTLGEFTFRDEELEETHYVTPLQPVAQEETGRPESGVMRMTVMEAVSQQ